jgi:hypothetical protein
VDIYEKKLKINPKNLKVVNPSVVPAWFCAHLTILHWGQPLKVVTNEK